MHDASPGRMARRQVKAAERDPGLVEYASQDPSAFAGMLGGLIRANVIARPEKRRDFDVLVARVGIWVTDIDEGVTLVFDAGKLTVYNGLEPRRTITIRADAQTVMALSNLRIGPLGLPVYYDSAGRDIAMKLLVRKLRIDGLLPNLATVNRVTRIFSVQ